MKYALSFLLSAAWCGQSNGFSASIFSLKRASTRLFYKENQDANAAPEQLHGFAPSSSSRIDKGRSTHEELGLDIATTPTGFPLVDFPQWMMRTPSAEQSSTHNVNLPLTVGAQVAVTNITASQWFHIELAATKQEQEEDASSPVIACVGAATPIAAAVIGISINRHSPVMSMDEFMRDYYDGRTVPSRALIHLLGLGRVSMNDHDDTPQTSSSSSSWLHRDQPMPLASPVHNIQKLSNWAVKLQRLHQERQRLVAKLMQAQARLSFLSPNKDLSSNNIFMDDCDGIGKLFEKAHLRALQEEEEIQNTPDLRMKAMNATQDIMADIAAFQQAEPDVAPTATEYATFERALRDTSSTGSAASNHWGPPDLFVNPESSPEIAGEQSFALMMQEEMTEEDSTQNMDETICNQEIGKESEPIENSCDEQREPATVVSLADLENYGMGFDVLSFLTLPTMTKRCMDHLPKSLQRHFSEDTDEHEVLFYEILSFVAVSSLQGLQHSQSNMMIDMEQQQSCSTLERMKMAHGIMLTHVQLLKQEKQRLFAQLDQFGETW